jgi:hypothetical protein
LTSTERSRVEQTISNVCDIRTGQSILTDDDAALPKDATAKLYWRGQGHDVDVVDWIRAQTGLPTVTDDTRNRDR